MGPQAGVKWNKTRARRRPEGRPDFMRTMPARQPAGEPLLRMVRCLLESWHRSHGAAGRYLNGDRPRTAHEARTHWYSACGGVGHAGHAGGDILATPQKHGRRSVIDVDHPRV